MSSGDTLLIFTPHASEPPGSNPATLDVRNRHPVLDFDGATNESAVFSGVMPRHYAGGGAVVYLHYAMTTATSGDVDWDVAWERIGDQQQDVDADSFAPAKSANDAPVPTVCGQVDVVAVPFSDGAEMDGVAAGDGFRLMVTRDAASDSAAGDAELLFVEVREAP
jgi:hypothetical protein